MVPGVVGSSPISHPTRRKFRLWLRNDLAVVSASTQNFRLFQIEPAALGFDLSFFARLSPRFSYAHPRILAGKQSVPVDFRGAEFRSRFPREEEEPRNGCAVPLAARGSSAVRDDEGV